ncbi:MAG: 4-alpha-glucanotransferase [Clostridiales Family XIII bacterium]|jgi:4-alpha-glucanotransferase|nr:4-alpha-glucanotransferase [Clostridiales Family XIII bacterium]
MAIYHGEGMKDFGRQAGILLPLVSLPSHGGIGTLGKGAEDFILFLETAGQSLWQILPAGPVADTGSPYQGLSAFAGNPYLIDLRPLHEDGLITKSELQKYEKGSLEMNRVDYLYQRDEKLPLLLAAASRFDGGSARGFRKFLKESAYWLDGYADHEAAREAIPISDEIKIIQYFFFSQWDRLRKFARRHSVDFIGDLPLYVSVESADYHFNRKIFATDPTGRPSLIAGVPPDAYSATGQIWNVPVYDWEGAGEDALNWWEARLMQAARMYGAARIDHFRGLWDFWSVPADEANARIQHREAERSEHRGTKSSEQGSEHKRTEHSEHEYGAKDDVVDEDARGGGKWRRGPGDAFVEMAHASVPGLMIVAEDLGLLSEGAKRFRRRSGFPGMKVLQFAFDGDPTNEYLPRSSEEAAVMYTGTHDNDTLRGWLGRAGIGEIDFAKSYLNARSKESLPEAMIAAALESPCFCTMIPLQDWLGLGSYARINTPGTVSRMNWSWRLEARQINGSGADALTEKIRLQTAAANRLRS